MFKRILLSGAALTAMTAFAVAQTPPAPAEPSTPPAAQQPMGSGGAGAGGAGMADPSAQAQVEDPNLYSNIQGSNVIGQNDEKIGSVADLLFDDSGQLKALVIGHGGVVGIGQTYRRMDVSELPAVQDGKLTMAQLNTAALEGIPEYTYPEAESGRAATDVPAGGAGGSAMSPADSTTSSPSASAPAEPATPPADASASASADGALWPASYLVGANITNADQSAEIQDLRVEGGKIAAVVLDKGSLGLGNDVTEVKFEDLAISGTPAEPKIALKAGASSPGLATEPSSGGADSSAPASGSAPAESAPSAPAPAAPAQ